MKKYLKVSDEIGQALFDKKPIVALESTIISHGMPFPENIETAQELEQIVRDRGVIPATIAILNGEIVVGLNAEQMHYLAKNEVKKASRMDLPYIISKDQNASTTVAATMICAQMAGIEVFVTGGIGGVHRGAEYSFDISADLQELAKTDMTVICAGAKAILDLEKTMEYLETNGVLTLGYQTDYLPAFYSRESPIELAYRVDSAEEIANIIRAKKALALSGSILVANPIPAEFSLSYNEMNTIIELAIEKAKELGIRGKELTPYLLDSIQKMTNKTSLYANIELIKNNAKLGGDIARILSNI